MPVFIGKIGCEVFPVGGPESGTTPGSPPLQHDQSKTYDRVSCTTHGRAICDTPFPMKTRTTHVSVGTAEASKVTVSPSEGSSSDASGCHGEAAPRLTLRACSARPAGPLPKDGLRAHQNSLLRKVFRSSATRKEIRLHYGRPAGGVRPVPLPQSLKITSHAGQGSSFERAYSAPGPGP